MTGVTGVRQLSSSVIVGYTAHSQPRLSFGRCKLPARHMLHLHLLLCK